MKDKFINLIALITIPSSITLNIQSFIEYKDLISIFFTLIISVIAIITGILSLQHWKIKKKIAQIELQQKLFERNELKEKISTKKKPNRFFKNNLIK